jgi:hypothetical protein
MPAASPGCCGPFRKREAEGGRASGPTPARASAGPSSREGAGHPKAEPADARVPQDVSRRIDRQVSCEAPTKPAECLRPPIVPDLRRPTRPARRPPRRVFPVGAQASPSASRAGDAFAWSGRALRETSGWPRVRRGSGARSGRGCSGDTRRHRPIVVSRPHKISIANGGGIRLEHRDFVKLQI